MSKQVNFIEAINMALHDAMEKDSNVLLPKVAGVANSAYGKAAAPMTGYAAPEPEAARETVEPVQSDVIEGRLAGPDVFFGAINAGPVMTNGSLSAYRLSPIGGSDVMRQAGLQPGDLLLQINGTSVANLDINDIVDRISAIETAELQISRNGSTRTVRLSFGE